MLPATPCACPASCGDALACGRYMGAGTLFLRSMRYVEQDQQAARLCGHDTLPAQEEGTRRSWAVPLLPLALGSLVQAGNDIPDGLCIWGLELFQKHQRRS